MRSLLLVLLFAALVSPAVGINLRRMTDPINEDGRRGWKRISGYYAVTPLQAPLEEWQVALKAMADFAQADGKMSEDHCLEHAWDEDRTLRSDSSVSMRDLDELAIRHQSLSVIGLTSFCICMNFDSLTPSSLDVITPERFWALLKEKGPILASVANMEHGPNSATQVAIVGMFGEFKVAYEKYRERFNNVYLVVVGGGVLSNIGVAVPGTKNIKIIEFRSFVTTLVTWYDMYFHDYGKDNLDSAAASVGELIPLGDRNLVTVGAMSGGKQFLFEEFWDKARSVAVRHFKVFPDAVQNPAAFLQVPATFYPREVADTFRAHFRN